MGSHRRQESRQQRFVVHGRVVEGGSARKTRRGMYKQQSSLEMSAEFSEARGAFDGDHCDLAMARQAGYWS